MNIYLKSMTIGLSLITGLQAMDQPEPKDVGGGSLITQGRTARDLTPAEKKNAYKMWLLKEHFEKSNNERTLPAIPKDIQTVIGRTLHELSANPVLNGELVYKGASEPFKIKDLLKEDGCIDLSNPLFGDSSKYLLITTDPEKFFSISKNRNRLVILIAPRFLIEDKIGSTALSFKGIMVDWYADKAPIGIFYRMERWIDLSWYYYLTNKSILSISKNNLYDLWPMSVAPTLPTSPRVPLSVLRVPIRANIGPAKNFMFIFDIN